MTLNNFKMSELDDGAQMRPSHQSRRELLEQSRLSRLPSLETNRAPKFTNEPAPKIGIVGVCAGCNARLDTGDAIQQKFCGCRKCVGIAGRILAAADEMAERERRAILQKMAGGCADE